MDFERIRRKTELIEAREKLQKLELGAQALITELRLTTDPLVVETLVDMDMDLAASLVATLKKSWQEALRLRQRINRLELALGE